MTETTTKDGAATLREAWIEPDSGNGWDPGQVEAWQGELNAHLDQLPDRGLAAMLKTETAQRVQAAMTGNGGDPWKIYTLADAYEPRPPVEYLVGGLLAVPSLAIVYGPPGCLKSFLMADCAACVAGGLPWLPPSPGMATPTPRPTKQAPVLWLDFDNGKRRTADRFDALGKAKNLPKDTPLYYVSMPSPWLDASDNGAMTDLLNRITARSVELVVIDNLGTVSGKADENSGDMIPVMSHMRRLVEESGATVVILHHERKGNGTIGRAGETLRGHSSIEASLDLALLVSRDPHAESIEIKSTKTRDIDVPDFGATFTYEWKPGTKDLATAGFWGEVVQDTTSDRAIESAVLDVLKDKAAPLSQSALKKAVKEALPDVGVNRIAKVADRMVSGHKITATSNGNGASRQYGLL